MIVSGEGPQPALGMIVGEAPGRKELEAGRPLGGVAGRLLDAALRAVGVARESVYITNVIKELLLDSNEKIRRPYSAEIEAWRPILEGEIENTAPAAILALGRTAATALTGLSGEIPFGSKIGSVYVTWHPAYLIHRSAGQSGSPYVFGEWLEQIRPWAEAIAEAEVVA